MTFRGGDDLDTGNVSGGGGGRGGRGVAIGGGVGGVVVLVLALVFGIDPSQIGLGEDPAPDQNRPSSAQSVDQHVKSCTLEKANSDTICRIVATTESLNDVWSVHLPQQANRKYTQPHTNIFQGRINTGCGAASSDVGPFYCPADNQVYIDPSFYDTVLARQLGGSNAPSAQMYVIAHEFGHHIQTMLGDIKRSQQDPKGESSGAVRVELQADCYAGLWFHHAANTATRGGKSPLLQPLTQRDIDEIIKTAVAIGDDHIQKVGGGRVNPNSWTHGSSEMRRQWLVTGYEQGDVRACNTFGAAL